ncbi:MAG: hypothetical protein ACLP1Q_01125 [Solirubrobacteraceae bacterium]
MGAQGSSTNATAAGPDQSLFAFIPVLALLVVAVLIPALGPPLGMNENAAKELLGDIENAYRGEPVAFGETLGIMRVLAFAGEATQFVATLDDQEFFGKA